jgi:hypothetical protein
VLIYPLSTPPKDYLDAQHIYGITEKSTQQHVDDTKTTSAAIIV